MTYFVPVILIIGMLLYISLMQVLDALRDRESRRFNELLRKRL